MKKLSLLLAVVFVFALTAVAQESGAASSSGQMSQDQTMSKKGHKMGAMGAKKGSTLTGCVSKEANADGMYTLSNGRYKKGVEIGPADKVKDHAGHQVKLTGKWGTSAEAGETAAAGTEKKGERHFEVDNVEHISDTCSMAPGGGTMGMSGKMKKGKKSGDMSNPQNPQ